MIACSALFLVSCALFDSDDDAILDVNGILKLRPGDKLYTSHNLWFDDKNEIFQVHYHRGRILPFGTEVKIVEAHPYEIVFSDVAGGETYRLSVLKKFAMSSAENYMKLLFTKKSPDKLVEGISPAVLDKIKKGVVGKGMSKNEVIICFGYPPLHRTPSISEDTWIFFNTPVETERVMFNRKGQVVDIIKHQEVKK
ncbi:MAG TPA: hypothetical protein DET40_00065 [Lentisphaeria bacterium]|nr:MAG: hypothetical protein A2X45_00705 [Lentisphaerae bacterium GWF2_50_93]HCE41926.1 hypothetical protein [Lentisphaeria bacterium]